MGGALVAAMPILAATATSMTSSTTCWVAWGAAQPALVGRPGLGEALAVVLVVVASVRLVGLAAPPVSAVRAASVAFPEPLAHR